MCTKIVAQYRELQQETNRVSLLEDAGFFLGRGKWTAAHKQLLRDACTQLQTNISLAKKAGSVVAFLAWKCGLPQHRVSAQMTKYHLQLFQNLQTSFIARYVHSCFDD